MLCKSTHKTIGKRGMFAKDRPMSLGFLLVTGRMLVTRRDGMSFSAQRRTQLVQARVHVQHPIILGSWQLRNSLLLRWSTLTPRMFWSRWTMEREFEACKLGCSETGIWFRDLGVERNRLGNIFPWANGPRSSNCRNWFLGKPQGDPALLSQFSEMSLKSSQVMVSILLKSLTVYCCLCSDNPCTQPSLRYASSVFGWKVFIDWDHQGMENKTSSKPPNWSKWMMLRCVLKSPTFSGSMSTLG